jgi:hypothetical protein
MPAARLCRSPRSNSVREADGATSSVVSQFEFLLPTDTVGKLDFLPRSQFLRQQAGFEKKALGVWQKG